MKNRLLMGTQYLFLIIAAFLSVFPLFWMLVSATNASVDVIRGTLLPGNYLLQNMKSLLAAQDVVRALVNSFRNAVVLTVVSLIITSLAGYGFEIYHDKHKDRLFSVLLLAMMVPFAATMIPLFRMFSSLNLVNSTAGFILPTVSTPFMIMLFRQSSRSFPYEMIEAARIDGIGEVQIFFRMYMPAMMPTYAVAMTITFMNAWNNYLWPKVIMLTDASMTMPMLVANLITGYVIDYGVVMLGVLISTIPTVLIFFFLQKSFVEGVTGSIK